MSNETMAIISLTLVFLFFAGLITYGLWQEGKTRNKKGHKNQNHKTLRKRGFY